MRTIILIALCFLLFSVRLTFAQPDPVSIQFVEAQPLWEHLILDTTFYEIGNQPEVNKYTVVKPHQSYRFGDDLMTSSYCTNHRGELYGYILEQLDIRTGEIKWQSFSTYYNDGLQDHYKNLYLRPDGNLEMIGIKRHGPYTDSGFFYWNTGGGKSNFIRKVFNYNNGDLLQTVIGQDSVGNIIPSYLTFYPVKFDSIYLVAHQHGNEINKGIVWGYDFYQLNDQHNLEDTLSVSTILFETSDSVSFFSYGQPPYIKNLDDTTLVCLMFQDFSHPEKRKAQLLWINIKDLQNIRVIKRMNVESLIPGNETSLLYFIFEVANNSIYFTQHYYDPEIQANTAFLTVLDHEGNIVHYLPMCTDSNSVYEALRLIYTSDDYDYFAAFPSRTGRQGFDILKLNRGSDSFQFISSLTSAFQDEQFARQMEVSKLYDDGLFVVGAYTKKLGAEENSAVKYYAFNAEDLGMNLSTSIRYEAGNDEIKVYPNPTDGIVNFDFDQNFSGRIFLFDLLGKQIGSYNIYDSNNYQISLENISSGIYYAVILDQQSTLRRIEKVIIFSSGR